MLIYVRIAAAYPVFMFVIQTGNGKGKKVKKIKRCVFLSFYMIR
ncbi:hypothetical protein HNR53_000953 [Bacillus benzoevorans]|uniref:Uncharacterized protein n=1 Tax=Bacillus benzoevorans TaxID=1456 RepID=A0A7X0HP22_9BACI|nr:hypothetical protein [Bacillus benzoevorans]